MPMIRTTLEVGDYTLACLPKHELAIERKALGDFISCCSGSERDRFERQLLRLKGCRYKLVVVEARWEQIELGQYRSKISPKSVTGSVLGWMSEGIPFIFAGDHKRAAELVRRYLFIIGRRRWRELRDMHSAMMSTATESTQ
jgi:ERCC4-type nuclease